MESPTLKERLFENSFVDTGSKKTNGQLCLRSTYSKDHNGYCRIGSGARKIQVHRLAYEMEHGPIPKGLVIDHKCRNRDCFQVAHLEAVTISENNRRQFQAGRTNRGKRRITRELAALIKADYKTGKYSHDTLAAKHQISRPSVTDILIGRRYKEK